MHALLILAIAFGAVSGDVGLGYQYKVPQTSYGVPSYQVGGNYNSGYNGAAGSNSYVYKGQTGYQGLSAGQQNNAYQGGYNGLQSGLTSGNAYQTAGNAFHNAGNKYQSTGQGNQYYTSGVSHTVPLVQPTYQVGSSSSGSGFQTFNQYQTANQYQEKYQHQYQFQQQPAQVFKHFYVHAAPEEPEVAKPRNPIVLPPPQKHYKIIFIKTPTPPGIPPQYVPVQQQNEEKTIVYVLVKKPEDYQDIVVPKVEQKPPSKPEVYFIKYNSKEDSQAVINNIVTDYNNKGQSTSFSSAGGDASSAGSSGLITGVASSGDYSALSNAGSGQIAAAQTENQLLSNLGTTFGQSSHSESQQGNFGSTFGNESAGAVSLSSTGANDNSTSNVFSSSTSDSANTISTSQGVPHESYGVPKFKVE